MRTPALPALLLVCALPLLWRCDSSTDAQVCDPKTGRGCRVGRTCAVDADGIPVCVAPGPAREGDLCSPPSSTPGGLIDPTRQCGPRLGCLQLFGVSRCMRFCDPLETEDRDTCQPDPADPIDLGPNDIRHPRFAEATCAAVLPGRADIGVCVLPCELFPGYDADCLAALPDAACGNPDGCTCRAARRACLNDRSPDCPPGSTCTVQPTLDHAVCTVPGQAALEAACSPSAPCQGNLVCHPRGEGGICLPPAASAPACACDERPVAVPDAFDPIEGGVYSLCSRCQVIGRLGDPARWYEFCPDGVDFVEALQVCSARAGCLVDLAGADAAAQVELARKLSERAQALTGGQPLRPWVRAVRSDAGWLWPNGDRVADALWTDGVPPEIGRCARFDAGGRLTATTCVGSGSTVCVFGDARAAACEVN
ncbi:MAG: hypothetical protein KC620_03275 [Myxococcales bacterium]|nr:hypothetical protein [Myxococcales bacterium]